MQLGELMALATAAPWELGRSHMVTCTQGNEVTSSGAQVPVTLPPSLTILSTVALPRPLAPPVTRPTTPFNILLGL